MAIENLYLATYMPSVDYYSGILQWFPAHGCYQWDNVTFIDDLEWRLQQVGFLNQQDPLWSDMFDADNPLFWLAASGEAFFITARDLKHFVCDFTAEPNYIDHWYGKSDFANRGVFAWTQGYRPDCEPHWLNWSKCMGTSRSEFKRNGCYVALKPGCEAFFTFYNTLMAASPAEGIPLAKYWLGSGPGPYDIFQPNAC